MIVQNGGNQNFQFRIDQANLAKTRTVSSEQGRVAAQNSGLASVKSKETESRTAEMREKFTLSDGAEAQLLKERLSLNEDLEQAKAGMADEANRSHADIKGKEKDREMRGTVVELRPETRVFILDDESEEPYEVTKSQGVRIDELDRQAANDILEGMPPSAKAAAAATLNTQMETKGTDKIAELRDDPKVTAQVECMDLDLADKEWRRHTLAPIRTQASEAPLQMDDPYAEHMAMAVAAKYMQSEQEQIVA